MRCAYRCTRRRANRSARVVEGQPGPANAARVCGAVEGNHGKTLANPPLAVYLCHNPGWSKFWAEMKSQNYLLLVVIRPPLTPGEDWQKVYSYRAMLRHTTTKTPKKKNAAKTRKSAAL
jgi:hypothetical protein